MIKPLVADCGLLLQSLEASFIEAALDSLVARLEGVGGGRVAPPAAAISDSDGAETETDSQTEAVEPTAIRSAPNVSNWRPDRLVSIFYKPL